VSQLALVRIGLVVFVLAWIVGPDELRRAVPVWVVFAIALGLEVAFLAGALRDLPAAVPERGPQPVDRERYGYDPDVSDLLLVDDDEEDAELWIPYSGETDEELTTLVSEAREHRHESDPIVVRERLDRMQAVRRFVAGLGVLAALAALAWYVESRTGWDGLSGDTRLTAVERFSDEASRIAGKPVTIRCDESRDYVGFVQHADGVAIVGGDRAYLTPERCYDLYRLGFEDEVTSSQTGRALAVLAHEAWHLRGVDDEGATECYAFQSGVELGERLGLSEDRARQLMRQQLTENRLRSGASIGYLVPPECRDGGRLDLDPSTDRFP
jgi:hypothetical protein